MTKKFFTILFSLALFAGFISCSDSDDDNNNSNNVQKLLTRLTDNGEYVDFEYDKTNKLVRIKSYDIDNNTESLSETTNISYNSEGRPLKIINTRPDDMPDDYDYVDFRYGKSDTVFVESKNSRIRENSSSYGNITDTLVINNKGYIIKIMSSSKGRNNNPQDIYYFTEVYSYDANDNVVKWEHSYIINNTKSTTTTTMEFDSKLSILTNQKVPAWFFNYIRGNLIEHVGKNNAIKYTEIEDNETGTISFEYDTDGYPTKRIYIDNYEEETISYTYKVIE